MSRKIVCLVFGTISAVLLHGQEPKATFEVATMKPDPGCNPGTASSSNAGMTPGRVTLPCMPLKAYIAIAYGEVFSGGTLATRLPEVLGGPGWLDSEVYTLNAKAEGRASTREMTGPMLRSLLEEKFRLKAHKESKDVPGYALVVSKPSDKLAQTPEGACIVVDMNNTTEAAFRELGDRRCGAGEMRPIGRTMSGRWHGITLDEFANRLLSLWVRRPVINKTGLTGRYDFTLEFTPEPMGVPSGGQGGAFPIPPDSGPSVYTALQEQLGLKLVSEKVAKDVVVIEHVERATEN